MAVWLLYLPGLYWLVQELKLIIILKNYTVIFCLASVNTMQNGNAAERPDDGGGEYVSSYNGVGSGLGSGSEVQQHRVRHSLGDPPPSSASL